MFSPLCPRPAPVAAGPRRARFAAAFGSFRQRTIDRRYSGLPFIAGAQWFAQAVRLAGGQPSAHCWQPFQAPARG